jgi:hypothetical protein
MDIDPQYIEIQLRPGWKVELMLPPDLTAEEAARLTAAIMDCVKPAQN